MTGVLTPHDGDTALVIIYLISSDTQETDGFSQDARNNPPRLGCASLLRSKHATHDPAATCASVMGGLHGFSAANTASTAWSLTV